MAMLKAAKSKWLKALRSGEFRQGEGYLKLRGRYCCLGVLCQILEPKGWVSVGGSNVHKFFSKTEDGYLSDTHLDCKKSGLTQKQMSQLIDMNDANISHGINKADFAEIADWIEAHVRTRPAHS